MLGLINTEMLLFIPFKNNKLTKGAQQNVFVFIFNKLFNISENKCIQHLLNCTIFIENVKYKEYE